MAPRRLVRRLGPLAVAALALSVPVTIVAHVGRVSPAGSRIDPPQVNPAFDDLTSQMVGLRFTDLDIPRNARILSACVEFAPRERTARASTLTIHARAVDDAPPIAGTGDDAGLKPLTVAGVEWSRWARTSAVSAGHGERTPDLSSMFQEIVDRPGWRPGNAVVLVFSRAGEGEAFEGGRTEAPLLHIDYRRQPG